MGLLDDLLGGLAGQARGGRAPQQPTEAAARGGGTSQVLIALMPIVLGMLANRGSRAGAPNQMNSARGGGGLSDVLGQVLGGATGGQGAGGGLGGLLEQLHRSGFGEQAESWVGTGQNIPISPDAVGQIFGRGGVEEMARRAGLTAEQTSEGLSQLLPEVVDRVTPQGEVPAFDQLVQSVENLQQRLGA